MWPHLGTSFHPTARARQEDGVFTFAKARNAAINTAGGANTIQSLHRGLSSFKLADSPTDGLSSKDSDLSHPSYQRLMTKGDKGVVLGIDHLQSDPRIKMANEFHCAKQVVNRSNQTFSTMFNQTSFKLSDRVRKNSILKPDNYLFQFEQGKADKSLIGVQNFDQIVKAVMGGYTIHPGASSETKRLMEKATTLAAQALAPSTKDNYGRAWVRFSTFCKGKGVDPMLATESDVSIFLVQRSEETDSPNMVEGDLKAIKCFRKQAGKPLGAIPLIPNVMAGILKNMEADSLNRLGFEPEHVQCLFKVALSENGPDNVVGIRQAALYAAMYWGTARFEEIVPLQIRQIVKKGASFELQIRKGKKNQTKKLQRCIVHPNAKAYAGNFCPVAILDAYLAARLKLVPASADDLLFPNLDSKFDLFTGKQVLSIKKPLEPMSYDNYRQRLKRHLDSEEFKAMGVLPEDYGTHSFRIGGSSVMGADQTVSPVFIQKNMRHKNIQSTLNYIRPSLGQALRANDLLCGNAAGEGWDARYTGNKRSLQPHLPQTSIKPVPQTSSSVDTGKKDCHSGLEKVRKTAPAGSDSIFNPALYNFKSRSATSKRITTVNPKGPSAAPSTAGLVVPGDASSHRTLILERLRASGIRVELKKAPTVKGGVNKPFVPRVSKTSGTKKKSPNPHPNLQAVGNRLSGCPVSVSLSQSVTATPQEIPRTPSPQPSYESQYLDWCNRKKEESAEPEDAAESVHSNADSATLTASDPDVCGQFSFG